MTLQHDSLEVQRAGGGDRGESAVSKHTTDSGLGLEATEGVILPGSVPRQLPPLRGDNRYENVIYCRPTINRIIPLRELLDRVL